MWVYAVINVGRSNVLHGLLEFAKLLKIVQNGAFSFCKHQIDVLHDILFEPIKSQKFRIEDLNVWIIGVEMFFFPPLDYNT